MQLYIKDFLDNDYTQYAVYRVYQRIPHLLDTLGQTQRKILFTLEQFPESKKFKTAEVYSKVYDTTSYLHGDASIYNVTENMARECGNNLNLLTPEGSFGYRTNRSSAAPRYTSTRFSKIARSIFRKEDKPILIHQEFEGKRIEDKFLLPILPISLVNGYSAIAVGFASDIFPRNPLDIINAIQEALKYKKRKNANWERYTIEDIAPSYPFFTGDIFRDETQPNKSAWYMKGKLVRGKRKNTIEILDVPPNVTREGYIKKLKKLQDKGIIRSFTESCVKNKFSFSIKTTPETWEKTDEDLMDIFGLIIKSQENFTFLNPDAQNTKYVIRYNSFGEYLKIFIQLRQEFYDVRKRYQLDKLNEEISVLKERIKFITAVNNNNIIITKRKKADLEKELKTKGYALLDSSYDYLLGMKMYSLTEENIQKFMNIIKEKENEFNKLEKTKIEDMHIKELEELKKLMIPELIKKGLVDA